MNSQPAYQQQPFMAAIPGFQHLKQLINTLSTAAYNIVITGFYNGVELSSCEKDKLRQTIRDLLLTSDDPQKAYNQFVQRVLMSRRYVIRNNVIVSEPSRWFHPGNPHGYYASSSWFYELQQKRIAFPLHRIQLKAFAEAIQEMQEEPTARNFHYWRSWFIEHKCQGLLNLFLATIANAGYNS